MGGRAILLGLCIGAAACGGSVRRAAVASSARLPARMPCTQKLTEVEQPRVTGMDPRNPIAKHPTGRVSAVSIAGNRTVPGQLIRGVVSLRSGATLSKEVLRKDLAALWKLEVFSDVQVHASRSDTGLRVTYAVAERPLVGHVFLGRGTDRLPRLWQRYRYLDGALFDPARFHRETRHVVAEYVHAGYLKATVDARARRRDDGRVDLCFAATPGPRYTIATFEFAGNRVLADAKLRALIDTRNGTENVRAGVYRAQRLATALVKIRSLYYDHGMINVRVGSPKVVTDHRRARVSVRIPVHEGPVFRLGKIGFAKVRKADRRRFRRLLGLKTGQIFSRAEFVKGLARIRKMSRASGRPVDVVPVTNIDTTMSVIDMKLQVRYL